MAIASITPTTFLLAIPILFIINLLYNFFLSPIRHIPGPILARLTNIYRASISYTGRACHYYRKWHEKYGTAVRVGPNAISISDPSLIKTIYGTKNAWIKSDMYKPNDILLDGRRISNIFNTPSKSFHATYASPIGTFWTNTKILHLEPLIDDTLSLFIFQLDTRFSGSKTCMMDEWLGYLAWDLASNVTFGEHHGFLEEGKDVKGMIAGSKAGVEYFSVISQMPWLDGWLDKNPVIRLGPRPLLEGFLAAGRIYERYLKDLTDGIIKKGCLPHFMDKYYGLKDTHKVATDEQILHWLMINVNAGGDSTAGAMRSVAYLTVKHPNVHEKLRQELDSTVTTFPASYQQIKDLPYLNAVLLESQRFIAPLGLMLERIVPSSGLTLPDGRFIPAGVKIGINPAVITRDREIFGEDADTFRPERWFRQDDEEKEAFEKRYRQMYDVADFVFGSGSRVCMGKHFVRVALLKTFATLFSAFDVRLVDPGHVWRYNISWFLYQSDIPMVVTRRQKL